MLSLFRTNQLAFNLFLLAYVLLVRGAIFVQPPPEILLQDQGILSNLVYHLIGTSGPFFQITGLLIVFLQGVLVNVIVARYRMAREISLLPGLFYILLASAIPEFLSFSPLLLANSFILLMFYELFGIYRKSDTAGQIFNIGFWVAMASMCYSSTLVFLLLAIIGIAQLRAFRPGELLILFIGYLVPFFLSGTYYFWFDQMDYYFQIQFGQNFGFLDFRTPGGLELYIKLGIWAVLILLALASFGSNTAKRNIQAQKYISILYWALLLSSFTVLFQAHLQLSHLLITVPPLAIFLAFNFQQLRPQIAETLHLLLLALVLILQFKPLLLT